MDSTISLGSIKVVNPSRKYEVIIIQANFTIFTIDDLFMRLKAAIPNAKIAIAMNESEPKVTRVVGNDSLMQQHAAETMKKIGASHAAIIYLSNAYPIQILNLIKMHPCVCRVFAASSNELEVICAETPLGRAVIGVVDGYSVDHIENEKEREQRKSLVRRLGYFSE
ncbi:MAG: adenosine-specific kinase [Candidatus Ranarchaeia archaeon]